MAYAIRKYRDEDAEALAEICHLAIEGVGPNAYSTEQVAAWLARHPGAPLYRERVKAGAIIFVAADPDDRPVAYALIEPDGHLDHLYNHPDHTRRGLAVQLLTEAEQYARLEGVEKIYTEASDLARPAFERAGYEVSHKRDFEIDGTPIHNWSMEKSLR